MEMEWESVDANHILWRGLLICFILIFMKTI